MKKLIILLLLVSDAEVNRLDNDAIVYAGNKSVRSRFIAKGKHPKNIFLIVIGQSNCGIYHQWDIDSMLVDGVHSWNVNKKRMDGSLSAAQTRLGLIGSLPFIAQGMKKKFPEDSLYFFQYHVGKTSLYKEWNPRMFADSSNLFNIVSKQLKLFIGRKRPDLVYLIWMQGEHDTTDPVYASSYLRLESILFNDLRYRVGVDRFYNYQISPISFLKENGQGVRLAKRKHADIDPSIRLIEMGTDVYNPDKIHMSMKGVKAFADTILSDINSGH